MAWRVTCLSSQVYPSLELNSISLKITGPFRVRVQFTGTGTDYGVLLYGRQGNQTDPNEWWKGNRRLDVDVDHGNLSLLYRDGTSPDAQVYELPQSLKGNSFVLLFNDDGSNIQVINQDGTMVKSISLSTPLFPDKVLNFGVNAGPNSILNVSQFSLLAPPDGKYTATATATKPPSLLGTGVDHDKIASLAGALAPNDLDFAQITLQIIASSFFLSNHLPFRRAQVGETANSCLEFMARVGHLAK